MSDKRGNPIEQLFVEECYKEEYRETPTYYMAEIYEHILFHGDGEWNFAKGGIDYMPPEELILVDWSLLRKFTQLHKGEEVEESEKTPTDQKRAMAYCTNHIKQTYKDDFGLPDPEVLPWDNLEEYKLEISSTPNIS